MRHLKRTAKLGRQFEHRNALLANLVNSLIKHRSITTTLAKAKAAQGVAERMLTLGKRAHAAATAAGNADEKAKVKHLAESVHCRRLVAARLHSQPRTHFASKDERVAWKDNEDVVHILCDKLAPVYQDRRGGYTRIIKLAKPRRGDAGLKAILQWVDLPAEAGGPKPAEAGPAAASAAGDAKA